MTNLLFIGDVMLGRLVNETLKSKPPDYVWGDTLPLFAKADFRFCNLECALSDRGQPTTHPAKTFHFRSDAKNISVLKSADINAVSLANNHVLDYGQDAFLDTLQILKANQIAATGAGESIYQAESPLVTQAQDLKIALFSLTDNEPSWEGGEVTPGINYMPLNIHDSRFNHLLYHISQIRNQVDLIIISIHWGPNWGYTPLLEHIQFAHELINNGADLIFGHSPHVFRGIEIYQNKPIIYSAGDFIDDYEINPQERNDQSFIFLLETENGKPTKLKLYPVIIEEMQTNLANDFEFVEITEKMTALSAPFNTITNLNSKDRCLEINL